MEASYCGYYSHEIKRKVEDNLKMRKKEASGGLLRERRKVHSVHDSTPKIVSSSLYFIPDSVTNG